MVAIVVEFTDRREGAVALLACILIYSELPFKAIVFTTAL